ncbi:MAG TPA: tetratricopeptide repeat protein [Verrucomicrobiae bacterium]|nr:tetratricopeptide repeat protein [Verrucomicrobiae bacterium]
MQRSAVLGAVVLGLAGCALPSTSRREAASAKTAEGNWTGPVDDYSPSAVQARTTAHAHYAAAILYSLDEQPERAGEEFFKAAMADLSNDALTVEASSRLLDLRKADRAIELLTNATARAGASGAVYARLGRAYAMAGKRDLAIDANRKAIKKNPELLAGYQYLAHLYLQNKQEDQAMNVLDEAGRQPRADAAYLIELAETYGMLFQRPGRTDKVKSRALEVLKRAAALKPAKSVLVQRLAEGFFEFGAPERAAETLAPLVERLPQMPGLRERLVDLLVRSNDRTNAIKHLRILVGANPGSLPINSMLGRLLLFDRKPKEAVEYLGQALRLNAGADPDYFYELAEAQINADEPKAALETLNRARKRFPQNFICEFYSALACSRMKDYTNAFKFFTAAEIVAGAKDTNRLTEEFFYELAGTQISADQPKAALETLDKARKRFPKQFGCEYYSALAYSRMKDYTNALKFLTAAETIARARETNRLTHGFFFELGAAYERNHKFKEAETYFRKCLELSPDFPEALNYLGYMWAERGENLREAHEMIEKAVKLEPKNAAFLDSLGWVLFRLDQPQDALKWIQKAIEHAEEPDATLFDHLGDIFAALKKQDQAREAWQKAYAIEPSDEIQRKLNAVTAPGEAPH